jgi:hypothetical protein
VTLPIDTWSKWELPPTLDLESTLGQANVPVLYGYPPASGQYLKEVGDKIELGLDVFGSVFFLLTRYEELVRGERDEHGRFPARLSMLSIYGHLNRPLVDEYVEVLWRALVIQWPQLKRKKHSYRLLLSHDVDFPSAYTGKGMARIGLGVASDLLKRRSVKLAFRRLAGYLAYRQGDHSLDIYNTFDFIMHVSESASIRSAFYFIPLITNPKRDGNYSLEDQWIRELLGKIDDSYRNGKQLLAEREKLKQVLEEQSIKTKVIGGRQHYLRWEPRESWALWFEAGFSYDSSVGFAEAPGFRCGTCREFPVYDLLGNRPLPKFMERPLIAMDVTFSHYQRLGEEEKFQAIKTLGAICRRYDGDMSLLWHNNNLINDSQQRLYRLLVDTLC